MKDEITNPDRRLFLKKTGIAAAALHLGSLFLPFNSFASTNGDAPPGIVMDKYNRGYQLLKEGRFSDLKDYLNLGEYENHGFNDDDPYTKPSYWFLLAHLPQNAKGWPNNLEKDHPGIYNYALGISRYVSTYSQLAHPDEHQFFESQDIEEPFIKSLLYFAGFDESEVKAKTDQYMNWGLSEKEKILSITQQRILALDDPQNIKFAEITAMWLTNHYIEQNARMTKGDTTYENLALITNKSAEIPLRVFGKSRASTGGPYYYNNELHI